MNESNALQLQFSTSNAEYREQSREPFSRDMVESQLEVEFASPFVAKGED